MAGLSKPADDQTYTLTTQRPQDPVTVKATLSLYSADTADSAINDGTASALTQLSVSFVISAKPASYEIKLEAVDSVTGDDISDAAITMKDRFGNLIEADGEGKYQVNSEMTYTGDSFQRRVRRSGEEQMSRPRLLLQLKTRPSGAAAHSDR